MLYVLVGIIMLIVGIIFGIVLKPKPITAGYLNVYDSNEPGEDPYLFLDLKAPVAYFRNDKYVTFEISQK